MPDVLRERAPDVERLSTVTGLVQVPAAHDRKAFEALSLPEDAEPLFLREGLEPLPQSMKGGVLYVVFGVGIALFAFP